MLFRLLVLLVLAVRYVSAGRHLDDPDLFHFVTRPDLRAPRWDITIYGKEQLSAGYWFVAPKQSREILIGTESAWIGPSIYDGEGQLVWSGATQLDTANTNDFRVSMINGEQFLSMFDRDRQAGIILDNHYRVHRALDLRSENVNAHEFNVVNNGNSALVLKNDLREMTQREKDLVGPKRECMVQYTRFQEIDLDTADVVFEFDSRGQIGVDESQEWIESADVSEQCKDGWWDFLHGNSVDKCPDGSYLFGSRFLSTIYKISAGTGEIIWRLGGLRSDFDLGNTTWSQQHNVLCQNHNGTHTVISMLDNEASPHSLAPDREFSRGLVIAVNEVEKTIELLASYEHPNHEYAPRRGNLQMLDNGNVFIGWSERALQTEHSANGTLLMKAELKTSWLGSYRNYNFDYVGKPLTRPDVVARVYFQQPSNATTHVYVSWNGDTEVKSWRLYSSLADGSGEELLTTVEREGFETFLESSLHTEFIRVEGVAGDGTVAGTSSVLKTEEHPSTLDSAEAQRISHILDPDQHSHHSNDKEQSEPGYDCPAPSTWSESLHIFLASLGSFIIGSLSSPWLSTCLSWVRKRCAAEYRYDEIAMEDELGPDGKESLDSDELTMYDDGLLDGNLGTNALPDR